MIMARTSLMVAPIWIIVALHKTDCSSRVLFANNTGAKGDVSSLFATLVAACTSDNKVSGDTQVALKFVVQQ